MAEIEVERELAQPTAQTLKPREPARKKANGHGKTLAAKAAEARADASGAEKAKKKPAASRSKKAYTDAKPSGAAERSGAAAKPARTRSRQTTPT